jgi:patatin-like phospholipase/acyl hydrolase
MRTANILSINGGGIRGLIALQQLVQLEKTIPVPLHEHFDYIAGTSTGGIIAVFLSIGYTPTELLDIYLKHGDKIFDKRFLRLGLLRAKYNDEYFNKVINDFAKGKSLKDCKTSIVIPSYNATKKELKLFKSDKAQDGNHHNYSLFDVVRSTASAPSYFKPITIRKDYYIDGGLVVNNPVMMVFLEALKEGFDTFNILSFSTGTIEKPLSKSIADGGAIKWAKEYVDILLTEMDQTTHYTMTQIFDLFSILNKKRLGMYIRCDSYIEKSSGKIDDASRENIFKMTLDGLKSATKNKDKMMTYYLNSIK